MTDLDLITLRLRILNVLLEKKTEQYHVAILCGDTSKQRALHKQCFDLCRIIDRLNDNRRKLGGEPECR